jgi:hypothetical protein
LIADKEQSIKKEFSQELIDEQGLRDKSILGLQLEREIENRIPKTLKESKLYQL